MPGTLLRRVRDTPADAEAVASLVPSAPGGGAALLRRRARQLAGTDPEGCWLAEDGAGRPLGAALASVREGLWGLSLLAVAPAARGRGLGTELLRRALEHGRGTLRGAICAPDDPAAARTCRRAGFTLHPVMRLSGTVAAGGLGLPDGPAVEGGPGDRDLMDSVDRRLRGGAHGPDHAELLRHCRVVVADDLAGSGYCYLGGDGAVELLAATSRRIAVRLLSAALHSLPPGSAATVERLTAEQEWAVDVGLAAGLRVGHGGYLCLRGMRPPVPYVPSALFL